VSVRVHTESVPRDLLKLWGFRERRDDGGRVFRVLAQTFVADGVGYASIDATVYRGCPTMCVVEFFAGGRVVNVTVAGVVLNLLNHATFARQFNAHVRPRVVEESRRLGVIGGGA
jgi:hypothetical protein